MKIYLRKVFLFSIGHFPKEWGAVLCAVLVVAVWKYCAGFSTLPSPFFAFSALGLFLILKICFCALPHLGLAPLDRLETAIRKHAPDKALSLGGEYLVLCLAGSYALCLLSYVACSLPFPFADVSLNQIDHRLGFDWLDSFRFFRRPWIQPEMGVIYSTLIPQMIFLIVWFSWKGDRPRLSETFWMLFAALLIISVASGLWPSIGPAFLVQWQAAEVEKIRSIFGEPMMDVMAIRARTPLDFSHHHITGIVTFPSFHTAAAVIYMYAFRRTGWIGRFVFVLNILMLLSIPAMGNHYLIDVIAGALIAVLVILFTRYACGDRMQKRAA